MSKIVQLKKKGFNEYPITIPEAVIDSNGVTVKDEIKRLERKINNLTPGESSSATPDWNAQAGEDGYIKNRTHYPRGNPIEENTYVERGLAWGDIREINPFGYHYYEVTINGESHIIDFVGKDWPQYDFEKDEQNKLEYNLEFENNVGLKLSFFLNEEGSPRLVMEYYPTYSNAPGTIDVSITDYYVDFKQLDEKFIPNTIARKQELTELSKKKVEKGSLATINGQNIEDGGNIVIEGGSGGADSPVGYGDAENSAVLKGEYQGYSNKALSKTSMAVGAATIAGLKGWYYRDLNGSVITILTTQPTLQNGRLVGGTPANGGDVEQAFKVGDVVSFVNHQKYDRYAKVINVEGNEVLLDVIIEGNLSSEVTINDIDDWSIFLPDKPHLGAVDFGFGAFAEGGMSKSINICSHAEGFDTEAYGQFSHAEGKETEAAYAAHSEGVKTKATGNDAHAEGHITIAKGDHSHAEGRETIADGYAAHAEGLYSIAGVGTRPTASTINDAGRYSHAEGNGTQASGNSAHSEGKHTLASGNFSHAEGFNSEATEQCAHAEGSETHATKLGAHAEGARTRAEGVASHTEGIDSYANGRASHTEGLQTRAYNESEHASGKYNKSTQSSDKSKATQFSIGIGTSDTDRKNAFEVKQNGDIYIEGVEGRIQDKLNGGSSATPDWNVSKGKPGYIENRTHYYNEKLQYRGEIEASINHTTTYVLSPYEYIDKDIYGYRAPDKIKFTGGGISFTLDFIKEPIPGVNEEDIQETVLKRFTIDSNNDIEVRYYQDGNPDYIDGLIIELDLIATDSGYREYITFTTEDYYVDLKQIDGIYIPGTVVKTTPQELSDTDKNQALSNLGIDPVIWKYLINPCIIKKGEKIPDDLLDENNNLKYDMHPNMYRVRDAGNDFLSIGGPNDIIDGHGNGVLQECAPGHDVWFSTDGYWDNEV